LWVVEGAGEGGKEALEKATKVEGVRWGVYGGGEKAGEGVFV